MTKEMMTELMTEMVTTKEKAKGTIKEEQAQSQDLKSKWLKQMESLIWS